jgi:hypothetical protein
MHLCYEILSLILFPLLPPLAAIAIVIIVIIVIVHLMMITSPALPFYARSNPVAPPPNPNSRLCLWGGVVGAGH